MKDIIGGVLFDILVLAGVVWLVNKFNPSLVQSIINHLNINERR
jgi:hypothetical protein